MFVWDGGKQKNDFGKIVDYHWRKLPNHFNHIEMDEYRVMPNHFHGIVHIVRWPDGCHQSVGAMHSREQFIDQQNSLINNDQNTNEGNFTNRNASPLRGPHGTLPGSLSAIIQNFLSVTTRKINRIRQTPGAKLWQRNYYEHIIRNDMDLQRIREYINNNPLNWESDKHYV